MSNLLQQLENNEAILLMFLAGELPEDDRTEVEQMLASDPALRQALAELSALQDRVSDSFATIDARAPLARREATVRNVTRALAAAQLATVAAQPSATDARPSRLRIAWWVYPIAVAAALVIGIILLSDNQPVTLPGAQSANPQYVEGPDAASPELTAQIFPDDLEKELITLNSDGPGLFSSAAVQDMDR